MEKEQELKLNWLAAGQIHVGNELMVFDRVPHMAVTYTNLLLIAGARDYGVVAVDLHTGLPAFVHDQDAGDTIGVLVDRARIFVITSLAIKQYCLSNSALVPMATVASLDHAEDARFTSAMTIDARSQTIYARISNGQCYTICAYNYHQPSQTELCVGAENCLETITHLFERAGVVYAVQGCVGAIYDIQDVTKKVASVQGSLCSLSAGSDCVVTAQRSGQSVTLWTPSFTANCQYQIGLIDMFPEGQHAAVVLHKGQLITFHPSHSLIHLFEWRRGDEQPSEALQSIFDHPKHARMDRTICRFMGVAEVLSPDDIVTMMLNLDVEQEELVAVAEPPAKMARTITVEDGSKMVDPTYFNFLDMESVLAHFVRDDDRVEDDYLGMPEIHAM